MCHPEPVEGRHTDACMVRQAHHDTRSFAHIKKRPPVEGGHLKMRERAILLSIEADIFYRNGKHNARVSIEKPCQKAQKVLYFASKCDAMQLQESAWASRDSSGTKRYPSR